jgi:hypothetical protein
MGKLKFYSTNFVIRGNFRNLGVIWGPETKLRTQNFEISSLKDTSYTNSDSEWGNEIFFQ